MSDEFQNRSGGEQNWNSQTSGQGGNYNPYQQQYNPQQYNQQQYNPQQQNPGYFVPPLQVPPQVPPPMPENLPKQQKSQGKKVVLIFSGIILLVVLLAISIVYFRGGSGDSTPENTSNKTTSSDSDTKTTASGDAKNQENGESSLITGTDLTKVKDVSDVVKAVMPSVVSITNVGVQQYEDYSGETYQEKFESSGSGVIIEKNDTEIQIVTNNHVIEGSQKISVQFIDETTATATVKGTDVNADLAIISIKINEISADTLNTIKTAVIGDSTKVEVGETAIAIGNALGYGQSVTVGVISALNREVTIDYVTNELIQTDAAINPGNSGGALLNSKGELIGINSVKYSSTDVEGMGYAFPITTAVPIMENLAKGNTNNSTGNGSASQSGESAYLGISGITVDEASAESYQVPVGVYVAEVESGSGAYAAGIQSGCIITKIEGQTISSMEDLQAILEQHKPGDIIEVTLVYIADSTTDYQEETVKVTLGAKVN